MSFGGFQFGPFQTDYQQQSPVAPPGQFLLANYVGMDWYAASYQLFIAGLMQLDPPILVPRNTFQLDPPGTVVAQLPVAGTFVSPGTVIQLTVITENLLSATFSVN
jgi:hypothetical protein